jgi:hypothetical protein
VFFPQGWSYNAGQQAEIDRPGFFRAFVKSIRKNERPTLNFLHILFPHGPYVYLASGENYGREWMRGSYKGVWGDVEWGVVSGKQRHYMQVQLADNMLNDLLDHMEENALLDESMLVVVVDHGVSFSPNDTRRSLADFNKASVLRVPLFIKHPGQTSGQRKESRAMTLDVLPTLLAAIGFSSEQLDTDGIDLGLADALAPRQRLATSVFRELETLDESTLGLSALVAENRAQLNLDSPGGGLWEIGPFDKFRGQPMEAVCEKSSAGVRTIFSPFRKLKFARPENTVQAYINGKFTGASVSLDSKPFLITSNKLIVASGYTWAFNERSRFFALVEPKYIKQIDWAPRAWLVQEGKCLGL